MLQFLPPGVYTVSLFFHHSCRSCTDFIRATIINHTIRIQKYPRNSAGIDYFNASASRSNASCSVARGQAILIRSKPSPSSPKMAPLSSQSFALLTIRSSRSASVRSGRFPLARSDECLADYWQYNHGQMQGSPADILLTAQATRRLLHRLPGRPPVPSY